MMYNLIEHLVSITKLKKELKYSANLLVPIEKHSDIHYRVQLCLHMRCHILRSYQKLFLIEGHNC